MELEITRYFVNFRDGTTSVVFAQTNDTIFGPVEREDTLVLKRIEDWTLATLQAALIDAITEAKAQRAKEAQPVQPVTAKFTVPVA